MKMKQAVCPLCGGSNLSYEPSEYEDECEFAEWKCNDCGGEIYEGETYYDIEGDKIHEDCFYDYACEEYADCRKEAYSYA